ncbi:hypothetical protein EW146_g6866 [Bondarzewia mesenterica]|uniref:Uncharacterized protein n=1 Tax=Bondarzewia mesenterica TaxID=1095465 RepID=A0A4S4LP75_9AGAM|nr:hypothetical protein EW146_g6866 [Bondarzewia mesenterica]
MCGEQLALVSPTFDHFIAYVLHRTRLLLPNKKKKHQLRRAVLRKLKALPNRQARAQQASRASDYNRRSMQEKNTKNINEGKWSWKNGTNGTSGRV